MKNFVRILIALLICIALPAQAEPYRVSSGSWPWLIGQQSGLVLGYVGASGAEYDLFGNKLNAANPLPQPAFGALTAPSIALNGATLGSNVFAATGTGNISGLLTLGSGATATTGGFTATAGNITATTGNVVATAGGVQFSTDTFISRSAAGVAQIGTAVNNALGTLKAAVITITGDLTSNRAFVGSSQQWSIGTDGSANTSGTITSTNAILLSNTTGNGILTVQGHQASGGGSFIKLRDDTLGNYGYVGEFAAINGGTDYNHLELTNPQSGGKVGVSSNGATTDAFQANALNQFDLPKLASAPATAPGAGHCQFFMVAGTNAGSGKLQAQCGTSTTAVTITDNIGSGF